MRNGGKVILQLSPFMFCTLFENPGIKLVASLRQCARETILDRSLFWSAPDLKDGGIKRHQRLGELLVCEVVCDDVSDLSRHSTISRISWQSPSPATICSWWTCLYPGPANSSTGGRESTTPGIAWTINHLFLNTKKFRNILSRVTCSNLFVMDFVVHRLSKLFQRRKRTNDVLEDCRQTKPVMSRLSSVVSVLAVQAGGNC